jgi:hypothetical protein
MISKSFVLEELVQQAHRNALHADGRLDECKELQRLAPKPESTATGFATLPEQARLQIHLSIECRHAVL